MFLAGPGPFVHYQTSCEHDSLKTNEPILMQIGINGPRGRGVTQSTLGVRKSRVKSQEAVVMFGAWRRHHSRLPCVK